MNLYFSKVPSEDQCDEDFIDENGKHFYYVIEISEDMFSIRDTSGRYVPFDIDQVEDVQRAFFLNKMIFDAAKKAQDTYDSSMQEVEDLMEHWNNEQS